MGWEDEKRDKSLLSLTAAAAAHGGHPSEKDHLLREGEEGVCGESGGGQIHEKAEKVKAVRAPPSFLPLGRRKRDRPA